MFSPYSYITASFLVSGVSVRPTLNVKYVIHRHAGQTVDSCVTTSYSSRITLLAPAVKLSENHILVPHGSLITAPAAEPRLLPRTWTRVRWSRAPLQASLEAAKILEASIFVGCSRCLLSTSQGFFLVRNLTARRLRYSHLCVLSLFPGLSYSNNWLKNAP
ncbi:hypothetical protein K439DRAFT_1087433 [Ramaria rubella]|nr:hypothetical protein K439DRAFT_1087433 [Ramaria rubella]